jgi:hypothetical protein
MEGGIFLTPKDLMKLHSNNNYASCANQHRIIRACIAEGKKKLTVKEYCEYEVIDFDYIWKILRG